MTHIHLTSCTSTMDEAARMGREGAPHLTLVTADEQTRGRGRQGKAWRTFEGQSFAGTFVLKEDLGPHLALVVCLAVLEACETINPMAKVAVKWPNDIMKVGEEGSRKIAGILVEAGSGFAVAGIGLNIGRVEAGEDFPGDFLLNEGTWDDRDSVINVLRGCVERHLHLYSEQGWPAFAGKYHDVCETLGRRVMWKKGLEDEIYGVATGLDGDGALMLKDESGTVRLIHAGEIISQGKVLDERA